MNYHIQSQSKWIQDKAPDLETNIGWIENNVDPQNLRAVWEGFVAIVDHERSKKFNSLVGKSEAILKKLPWPEQLNKETWMAPDF